MGAPLQPLEAPPAGLFDALIRDIEIKYAALGHSLGWRFLCVSRRVLEQNPKLALITLNPGGRSMPLDQPSASCEHGSAYLVERWGNAPPGRHRLQVQVQRLFAELARELDWPGAPSNLIEQSLVGYFVPFRSPRLTDLHAKDASFNFGTELWTEVLRKTSPRIVFCIDRRTFAHLRSILLQTAGASVVRTMSLPTGWGRSTADIDWIGVSDTHATVLVRLPHLSSYQILSSARCRSAVKALLGAACRDLA